MPNNIIVSVVPDDKNTTTERLLDMLVNRFGRQTVASTLDVVISPGGDYVDDIEDAVKAADVVLVVIGRNWLDGDWMNNPNDYHYIAITTALENKSRLIPLVVENAVMPSTLPEQFMGLTRRKPVILNETTFRDDVGNFIKTIEGFVTVSSGVAASASAAAAPNPYANMPQQPAAPNPYAQPAQGGQPFGQPNPYGQQPPVQQSPFQQPPPYTANAPVPQQQPAVYNQYQYPQPMGYPPMQQAGKVYRPPINPMMVPMASWGDRFVALLIDGFIRAIAFPILIIPVIGWLTFLIIIPIAYHVYFLTNKDGQTPGKSMMGIRIVRADGQPLTGGDAVMRNVLGYLVSSFFLIGFLMPLFDDKKQGLHDKLANTYVIKG